MEIIEQMQKIAKRYIKHYYSDFTEYDLPTMQRIMQENSCAKPAIWIVRPCGSWLLESLESETRKSIYTYYLEDKAVRYYEIDLGKQRLILIKDRKKYYKERVRA